MIGGSPCSRSFAAFSLLSLLVSLTPAQAQTPSHSWQVTSSNTGSWSYAERDVPVTGQSTPHSPAWTVGSDGGGGGSSTDINGDSEGTVTATLTWIPATGQTMQSDPPPSQVSIIEYGYAWENSLWSNVGPLPGPSGTADDGLGDAEVASGNGFVSQGYHALAPQDGSSGVITVVSPMLKAINPGSTWQSYPNYPGYHYWDWTGGECTASFSVFPVNINLAGAAPDSSGNLNILVGQHCSASLVGIPSSCTVSSYQWSVSGTTFQTWSADTPAVGGNSYNGDASYEVDGPGPLTNSTAGWYWNDIRQTPETVSCTATVTPPAGQGSAFTVTVTQKVTVMVPLWTCKGVGGNMQVNTVIPVGNRTDFWLHAGPTAGSVETGGMDWYATVTPPLGTSFGAGSLEMVQKVIPNVSYTVYTVRPFTSTHS